MKDLNIQLIATSDHWSDMSFARVMKLALECEDDSILGAKGKNMMDTVKVRTGPSKNQGVILPITDP